MNNSSINIVYDNWDHVNVIPYHMNCKEIYTDSFLMDLDAFIKSIGATEDSIKRYPVEIVEQDSTSKFYYVVTLTPNQIKNKIEDGINPLPEKVINLWKNYSNLFIVFANEHEWEGFECFKCINEWITNNNLNPKQFFLVNNNSRLKEYKDLTKSEINVHTTRNLKSHIAQTMDWTMKDFEFREDKNFLFLCHNRKIRSHRYALLCLLKQCNLLENMDWSLTCGWEGKNIDIDSFYGNVLSAQQIKDLKNEMDFFHNIDIKKSFYEESKDWFKQENIHGVDFGVTYETKTYENSYFNIITETEFDNEVIHITEKSLKPFVVFQIPIFCSSPNHIKEFRKIYDFDLFDDLIDHSYDAITDHKIRLLAVLNEIKKINDNKEFYIDFYIKNKDRFIKNREKAMLLINDNSDKNWLNTLL